MTVRTSPYHGRTPDPVEFGGQQNKRGPVSAGNTDEAASTTTLDPTERSGLVVSLPRPRQTAPSGPPQREYRAIYYRQHGRKCSSKSHREWRTLGYCLWPRAVWVVGQGEWASVSYCRAGSTSVMFHPTEHDARQALEFIDHYACGGRCSRNHALVRIAPHLHPAGWHS